MRQASRVRFRFDDEALEVLIGGSEDKTENAFVGGARTLPCCKGFCHALLHLSTFGIKTQAQGALIEFNHLPSLLHSRLQT